jgi:hypothetical protein
LQAFFAFTTIFTAAQAATEREVAEWVLRWEGSVLLEGAAAL